jgi:hypothetical protein
MQPRGRSPLLNRWGSGQGPAPDFCTQLPDANACHQALTDEGKNRFGGLKCYPNLDWVQPTGLLALVVPAALSMSLSHAPDPKFTFLMPLIEKVTRSQLG